VTLADLRKRRSVSGNTRTWRGGRKVIQYERSQWFAAESPSPTAKHAAAPGQNRCKSR
jgi:hypothetical protein